MRFREQNIRAPEENACTEGYYAARECARWSAWLWVELQEELG